MAHDAGVDHEDRTENGQCGQHIAAQGTLSGFLAHPLDEHGDVHSVDGNDGKLGGVEHEGHALEGGSLEDNDGVPGTGEVCHVEVQHPEGTEQQGQNRRVVGHIGALIHLTEELGLGAAVACAQSVHAAAAGQHQAVHGAHAGDGNEEVEDVAQNAAEDVGDGVKDMVEDGKDAVDEGTENTNGAQ